jgi:hypothetical protein
LRSRAIEAHVYFLPATHLKILALHDQERALRGHFPTFPMIIGEIGKSRDLNFEFNPVFLKHFFICFDQ